MLTSRPLIQGLLYGAISQALARSMRRWGLIGLAMFLTGCAQTMMLPPTIYTAEEVEVFGEIDDALASSAIDVAYFTDRKAETSESGQFGYGIGRSQSLAFGTARVEIGKDLSWNDVDAYSRGDGQRPTLNLVDIEETGRFPATPYLFDMESGGRPKPVPEIAAELRKAEAEARALIKAQLDRTDVKEVFMLVHGVANDFEDAVFGAAEAWHFMGRRGVAIAYTWPAGAEGLFFYTVDRESGEFTILHFKQLLRFLAEFEEIEKIHLLAHSRGTDVVVTALRELVIEARAAGADPRDVFKIENIVLAAPDIDVEVALQRISGEALGSSYGRATIYTNAKDEAILAARALFDSRLRLGAIEPSRLTAQEKQLFSRDVNTDLIVYEGAGGGIFQHSYFRDPVVSSDLVLLLRHGYAAGEGGRESLESLGDNMWRLTGTRDGD